MNEWMSESVSKFQFNKCFRMAELINSFAHLESILELDNLVETLDMKV